MYLKYCIYLLRHICLINIFVTSLVSSFIKKHKTFMSLFFKNYVTCFVKLYVEALPVYIT